MTAPRRADARRNRALLLDAAEAVFAAKGTGASTEDVAAAAGVGIGTLFRHFPTKEALLAAVLHARLSRLAAQARALLDSEDPGVAFADYFREVVGTSGTKLAIAEALGAAGIDASTSAAGAGPELAEALSGLLVRAQQAGSIRADIGVPELFALLAGASRAVQHATSAQARARVIDVVLDGLRSSTRDPR